MAIGGVGSFLGEGKLEDPERLESAGSAGVGESVEDAHLELMVGLQSEKAQDVNGAVFAGFGKSAKHGIEEVEGLEDEGAEIFTQDGRAAAVVVECTQEEARSRLYGLAQG